MLWYNKCENLYKESVYNFSYNTGTQLETTVTFTQGKVISNKLNTTHGALFTTVFNFDLSIISSLGQCFLPTLLHPQLGTKHFLFDMRYWHIYVDMQAAKS